MARFDFAPLPPQEALAALRARGLELHESFSWQDVWQEAHATAFTVAKSTGFDILKDIHDGLARHMAEGGTAESFVRELRPVPQAMGWWGRREVEDPETGESVEAQLGSPRLLRTIFNVNMRVSYAAGRWACIERLKARRPYLRYVAVRDARTRPLHRDWHGTVLPVDHPWWRTHAPPNGWNCRCDLQQLSERDLKRLKLRVSRTAPDGGTRTFANRRTGAVERVPRGIDPGWAYNPGAAVVEQHAARVFAEKTIDAPPRLAARATAASARFLLRNLTADFARWARLAQEDNAERNGFRVVGALGDGVLDWLEANGGLPSSGAVIVRGRDIVHLMRESKAARGAALPEEALLRLPELLARPLAVLWDKATAGSRPSLVYVLDVDAGGRGDKAVVRLDQVVRVRDASGRRIRRRANRLATATLVDRNALRNRSDFELIEGEV